MCKHLHLALKREYYEQVVNGNKRIEYREVTDYWRKRLIPGPDTISFSLGYTKQRTSTYKVLDILVCSIVHPHFGPFPTYVFAIHFE